MQVQYVPEIDVIVAVAKWLHSEGWQIEVISMPSGQGIDRTSNKNKMKLDFIAAGIPIDKVSFKSQGEDIRAKQGDQLWKIECKGLGDNLPSSTVRNNFDRALASAASYYTQKDKLRLGLALPEEYIKLIRDRVPQALRMSINLWILLYVKFDNEIVVFAPNEEIPS